MNLTTLLHFRNKALDVYRCGTNKSPLFSVDTSLILHPKDTLSHMFHFCTRFTIFTGFIPKILAEIRKIKAPPSLGAPPESQQLRD